MDIKIVTAVHKPYWMPEDRVYVPLHIGREGKQDIGFTGDNTGDNISEKNATFCELTGLYWAWKNLQAEYVGLVHYRRVFGFVSERLLDVWLEKNQIAYKEQNVSFMEPQNWIKKGGLFLKRKFFGK